MNANTYFPASAKFRTPTSCSPQAWASGAVLLLLRACLGLEVRGARGAVRFNRPFLPESLRGIISQALFFDHSAVHVPA